VSISSMMDVAYQRRADVPPLNRGLTTLSETAQATGERPETQSTATTALKNMMTYIPGEILTTYVAVVAVIHPTTAGVTAEAPIADWVVFIVFLVLTPVVSWLLYAAKCVSGGKPLPSSPAEWPLWEMSAATVAFLVWAATLPETPLGAFPWYTSGLAAIILLIVSMILGLIAPLFTQRPLPSG
jgi:hypothetical protein